LLAGTAQLQTIIIHHKKFGRRKRDERPIKKQKNIEKYYTLDVK